MGTVQQLDKSKPKSRCTHWRLWVSENGVRRSKRFTGSYTQACRELAAFEAQGQQKEPERPESPTFAEYASKWLAWRKSSGAFSPNTICGNTSRVKILSASSFGGMRMDEITPTDARALLVELQDGRKASSVNELRRTLSSVFNQAVSDGIISRSPFDGIPRQKVAESERRALSRQEIEFTLDMLDSMPLDGYTVAVRLMLMLGLRRGEALGVCVDDVEGDVLHVRRQLLHVTNKLGEPKSKSGIRTLPMPPRLQAVMDEWLGACKRTPDGRIIVDCRGHAISVQGMGDWWRANRDALGCSGMVLHELRHSNLSLMARFMPSPFDLQHWAGWSSLEQAKRYIHHDQDALQVAVAAAFDAPETHQETA